MCSLCAVLGSSRSWTDAAGRPEWAPAGHPITRRHEREQRVALLNSVLHYYQLQVYDWGGTSYVVTNVHGKSAHVYTLQGIWAAAEQLMAGHGCDPLDVDLLEALEAKGGRDDGEPPDTHDRADRLFGQRQDHAPQSPRARCGVCQYRSPGE